MATLLNEVGALGAAVLAVLLVNASVHLFRSAEGSWWAKSESISMIVALLLVAALACSAAWLTTVVLLFIKHGLYAFGVSVAIHIGLLLAVASIWRPGTKRVAGDSMPAATTPKTVVPTGN